MNAPLLWIAAGGTGGHMFPAQALAEEMLARGWRVRLATDVRGARYVGAFPEAVEVVQIPSATFARGGLVACLAVPLRLFWGIMCALIAMRRLAPDVVVGFGGYPAIPAMAAAVLLKRPAMIHEQNGVPGRVNRLFAKRVALFACGTWPAHLPKGVDAVPVGNPVRARILRHAGAGYIPPGDYPMSLLVIGGSQGARILSDIVPQAVSLLPPPLRDLLRVAQQARAEDIARVAECYGLAGIRAEVRPFFDDVPRRISEAQLVISRAGASSIADITVIGRPSILIPFAQAASDHQTVNAQVLVKAGAAILIPQSKLTPQSLSEQIALVLSRPDGAQKMAAAAVSAARPEAARTLADLVIRLAAGKEHP